MFLFRKCQSWMLPGSTTFFVFFFFSALQKCFRGKELLKVTPLFGCNRYFGKEEAFMEKLPMALEAKHLCYFVLPVLEILFIYFLHHPNIMWQDEL